MRNNTPEYTTGNQESAILPYLDGNLFTYAIITDLTSRKDISPEQRQRLLDLIDTGNLDEALEFHQHISDKCSERLSQFHELMQLIESTFSVLTEEEETELIGLYTEGADPVYILERFRQILVTKQQLDN